MLPESFATLYTLLGLVAPGLLFQWVRERQLPLPEESPFREISRIALSSLVFTWLSTMGLALLSQVVPDLLVDLEEWIAQGRKYLEQHLWLAAWSATLEVAVACVLAVLTATLLKHSSKVEKRSSPIVYTTPWYEALQGSMTGDEVPWVLVTLADDTKIWGKVFRYTLSQVAADEQQIALTGPGLATQRPGEARKEETYWKFVLVSGSNISIMKVATSN